MNCFFSDRLQLHRVLPIALDTAGAYLKAGTRSQASKARSLEVYLLFNFSHEFSSSSMHSFSSRCEPWHLNSGDSVVQYLIFGWKRTPTWQRANVSAISEVYWKQWSTVFHPWWPCSQHPIDMGEPCSVSCSHMASWPVLVKSLQLLVLQFF